MANVASMPLPARPMKKREHVVDALLYTASAFNRLWFLHLPDLALSVPRLPSIIRFLFFYTIAQALGLLWGFVVIALQVLSRRLCDWLVSEAGSEQLGIWAAVALVGRCYVLFSTLRMLFLLAGGLWTLAWEASGDFPTVQRLLLGSERTESQSGSTSTSRSSSKAVRQRWNLVLAVPIAVITLSFAVTALVPVLCGRPELQGACGAGWLTEQLASADGRGNRMLRFSLVIMMIQWGQILESVLPTGIAGLCKDSPCFQKAALVLLMTSSMTRLSRFAWRPSDHVFFGNSDSDVMWGLSRHQCDNVLAVIIGCWLTLATLWAPPSAGLDLRSASRSSLAGYLLQTRAKRSKSAPNLLAALGKATSINRCVKATKSDTTCAEVVPKSKSCRVLPEESSTIDPTGESGSEPRDDSGSGDDPCVGAVQLTLWEVVSTRFQYTFILSCVLYWGRSCLSPQIGWNFAQVDLMALCFFYPLMSIIIWSVTFAVLSLKYVKPRWAIVAVGFPALAVVLVRGDVPTALAIVHLLRQVRKLLSTRAMQYAVRGHRQPHAERRWAGGLMYIGAFVLVAWFCGLSALTLAAGAQQRLNIYPGRMEFTPGGAGNSTLHIGHHAIIGNHLFLSKDEPGKQTIPANTDTYGICGQTWGGLGALDYALLSLASYWDADDPQLAVVLKHFFPEGVGISAEIIAGSRVAGGGAKPSSTGGVPWVELRIPEVDTHIVSVRGTDPTNLADVVEDIRMWTEPVVLGILSIAFPTVHVWSGPTVDNWVSTTHAFLGVFDLETGPWSYEPLVTHLRRQDAEGGEVNGTSFRHSRLLTGHSLGGGIAQIAAALTGTGVFAISPPGLMQSFMKYWQSVKQDPITSVGSIRAVHQRSVSLVVEGDWISRFDTHAGFVQTIACNRDDLSLFGGCHLLESTICHLLTACGDPRGRWTRCSHVFDPHAEGAQLLEALPEHASGLFRRWVAEEGWPGRAALRAALVAACVMTAFNLVLAESSLAVLAKARMIPRLGF